MRRLQIWLALGCLAAVLASAGCAANQPMPQLDNVDQRTWNAISVPEPSGENTDMGLWVEMRGGG